MSHLFNTLSNFIASCRCETLRKYSSKSSLFILRTYFKGNQSTTKINILYCGWNCTDSELFSLNVIHILEKIRPHLPIYSTIERRHVQWPKMALLVNQHHKRFIWSGFILNIVFCSNYLSFYLSIIRTFLFTLFI